MIVQKDFLIRLKKDFNLNIYEVKIWTSLLSRGMATAGELADISGVPRSRCYDVLESLEKKNFIIMKIGKPIRYIAVKPNEIIDRVRKNIQKDTDLSLSMIERIRTTNVFRDLELLHKTGIDNIKPEDLSKSVKGRDNINFYLKNMVANAKKSVLIISTQEGIKRKLSLLKNILSSLNKRNVRVKIVAPVDNKTAERIKYAKIKNTDPKARLVVVDKEELLFMLSDDSVEEDYDTAVWIKSPYFVNSLEKLFEGNL